jgi:hypothetical protein
LKNAIWQPCSKHADHPFRHQPIHTYGQEKKTFWFVSIKQKFSSNIFVENTREGRSKVFFLKYRQLKAFLFPFLESFHRPNWIETKFCCCYYRSSAFRAFEQLKKEKRDFIHQKLQNRRKFCLGDFLQALTR